MNKNNKSYDYIIIGASKAGLTAAAVLRERLGDSSILIINGEDRLPYKRTALTKHLACGFARDDFTLYPESWFEEQRIMLVSAVVLNINPLVRTLVCSDGQSFSWGALLLATGALPFQIPIPGSQWLRYLRTASDTEAIREQLVKSRRVVILGQGVEGVELAEQCRCLGLEVTLTGRDSRLMQRWLDEALSARLQALLEDRGIRCPFDQSPVAVVKEADGYTLSCKTEQFHGDMILASTGILGNPGLARELGIYGETGILVDAYCRTSQPGIYAAGDAVQTPPGWPTGLWHWAEYQGNLAALNMAGQKEALENAPTRLKCEPFGQYLYSMSYQEVQSSDDSELFMDDPSGYLRIFSRRGRSIAALMEGLGKEISKILDEGIKAGDSPEAIFKSLQKG